MEKNYNFPGPGKGKNGPEKPGPSEDNREQQQVEQADEIVNSGEQEEVVNEQDNLVNTSDTGSGKDKGYREGNHNDSLTEPEEADSDEQLHFPDEEELT